MTKYIKREIIDLNGDGQTTKAYYWMKREKTLDFNEFARMVSKANKLYPPNVVQGVIMAVGSELAYQLAQGNRVKIDGIGSFHAKLGISRFSDKEMDGFEEGATKRNARSLGVTGVGYKADKNLVWEVDRNCDLERGGESRLRKSKYTKEERIERAIRLLRRMGVMHVRDYAVINDLSYASAYKELQGDLVGSATITSSGSKSAKVYFLKPE